MESLSETKWDVVIAGTGLSQSLLALSLSHSGKKVLHLDRNDYYGSCDAAFSLQDAEEWVNRINDDASSPIKGARLTVPSRAASPLETNHLGPSRSYTLTLSPQLLYAQSALLPLLVTSRVHTQLEFQAVGSWWIYQYGRTATTTYAEHNPEPLPALQKIPSSREDVFSDDTISTRDKRGLMKFLRHLLRDTADTAEQDTENSNVDSLADVLSSQFKIPPKLQQPLLALSLSQDAAHKTNAQLAMLRIRKHLRSIGTFGPGFGAMMPKYGGGAEIAQVGCRAGAVGGGVYVLGRGIDSIHAVVGSKEQTTEPEQQKISITLSDGEIISADYIIGGNDDLPDGSTTPNFEDMSDGSSQSARSISIVSSPLSHLFPPTSENGPIPAGAVVVIGSKEATDENTSDSQDSGESPIYMLVHSSDSGECPAGQSVIYGSTAAEDGKAEGRLVEAVERLAHTTDGDTNPSILWSMYYVQYGTSVSAKSSKHFTSDESGYVMRFPPASLDLAFDDGLVDSVKAVWRQVMGVESKDVDFMRFEEREVVGDDDEE